MDQVPLATASQIVCACGVASPVSARFCATCGRPLAGTAAPTVAVGGVPEPRRDDNDAITVPHRRSVEERRTVTALFADLSGFTTLAGRLDTEELLAVVDPIVSELAGIVHRYDGYIEKFAGDALLALFGAPVAHEDDPDRALQVALEMHEHVAGVDAGLALHIGVNTGTVVARSIEAAGRAQYAALGEPVILAQRLQSMATAGETYVGELTARLTRDRFAYDDLGVRAAKGLAEPLRVFRLAARQTDPSGPDSARMIGRDTALATVLDALSSRPTAAVHVEGPAGSGKSRLLAELRARLTAQQVTCVEIAGASYTQSAYRCFAPLITEALRARYPSEPTTAARLRRLDDDPTAPDNAVYTTLLTGRTTPDEPLNREPQAVRQRLHEAATGWLHDLGQRSPLVVLVDNYQWLERSSTDLLDQLISTAEQSSVTFCTAGRPPARPGGDITGTVVLALEPLHTTDVAELVGDELGLAPDRRLVDFVDARSQGNPLMVRETVRQLRDEELLDVRLGHARLIAGAAATALPTTLEALLAARIDTMSPRLIGVATAASAVGFRVPVRVLAAVLDDDDVGTALAELASLGVVQLSGADDFRFDSTLLRDVFYARMTGRRRRALHSRVADVIESIDATAGSGVAQLAEHRYLAGDERRALPLLREAARQARAVFAHDQAITALTRALQAARAVQPDEAPELLCDSADLRMELGEYERAGVLFGEAKDSESSARAWAGYAATLRRRGDYADGQKTLQHAFDAEPSGDVRLLWCELSWNLSVSGDLGGSLQAAQSGLALGSADDEVAGLLLSQMVRAETLQGDLVLAHEHVEHAIRNLEAADNLTGLCSALRLLGALQERQGQLELAADSLERGLSLAERTGLVEEIGGCLVNLGMVRGALDDHRAAADCYARAETVFEQVGHRAGQAVAYGNHAYELFRMGESEQGRLLGERGVSIAEDVGNHYFAADIHHTLALIAESTGDVPAARHHAESAINQFDLAGMPDYATASRELAQRVSALD